MNLVHFQPNVPMQLSLSDPEGEFLSGRWKDQVIFQVSDGRTLLVDCETAAKINLLELQPGDPFCVCQRWTGKANEPRLFEVWLTPQAEQQRAAVETNGGLERQLQASIDQALSRRKPPRRAEGPMASDLGTGTFGPVPQARIIPPMPVPATLRRRPDLIPFNIAFTEILSFVVGSLNTSGEQWSEQSRQDLVSTVLIAAAKAGLIGCWERPGR